MKARSEKEMEDRKPMSYFFVFREGHSTNEEEIERVFQTFSTEHSNMLVRIFMPGDTEFEELRRKLEVRMLPSFAIADEEEPQSFISFERVNYIMEKLKKDEGRGLYELIGDLHYSLIDEGIVRVDKKMAYARLSHIFGKVWDEVEDLVTISL